MLDDKHIPPGRLAFDTFRHTIETLGEMADTQEKLLQRRNVVEAIRKTHDTTHLGGDRSLA